MTVTVWTVRCVWEKVSLLYHNKLFQTFCSGLRHYVFHCNKKFKNFNKFSTDLNNNWGENVAHVWTLFFYLVEDIFGQNFCDKKVEFKAKYDLTLHLQVWSFHPVFTADIWRYLKPIPGCFSSCVVIYVRVTYPTSDSITSNTQVPQDEWAGYPGGGKDDEIPCRRMRSSSYVKAMGDEESGESDSSPKTSPQKSVRPDALVKAIIRPRDLLDSQR